MFDVMKLGMGTITYTVHGHIKNGKRPVSIDVTIG